MMTPFAPDDSVDRKLLADEARFLLSAGVNGVVVAGSTGEGAGMSEEEIATIVSVTVEAIEGNVPVLCGVIADTSEEAVRLGLAARKAGAAGLQVPPPHFYFVTDSQVLARYYQDIADGTGLPLIIYNVIPWAQVAIDSLARITSENPAIIGVKQSGYNIHALADLVAFLKGKVRIYSAIDDLVYPSFMMGADGTISGVSSVFPRETVEMYRCVRAGQLDRALQLHNAIVPVWRAIEGPQFPGRMKYAMALLGRGTGKPRSPFAWPDPAAANAIENALTVSHEFAVLLERGERTTAEV
jgi:4-hydroxy-tetrahydrodipicolinate synthase